MKVLVLLAILALPSLSGFAATTSQAVSYPSGQDSVRAILYKPQGKGPFPALLVIHEWWGLNDWVKDQAAKLADQGYVTLAIDLYRGKVATTPELAHEIMRGVPEDRAKQDLHAGFEFLEAQPEVDKKRVGVIGWCMGGGYALDVALQEPGLRTAVINYGHLATDRASLAGISASILGIFGGKDQGISVEDVRTFEQSLRLAGKQIKIVIYPDAGHAFENPNNKSGYRSDDANDAWRKTLDFLSATLKE